MKREHIERMLSHIDNNYIKEAIDAVEQADTKNKKSAAKTIKWVAAAVICVVILGSGITVTAAVSNVFRNWLTEIFGGHEITKVELTPDKTPAKDTVADLPVDQDLHLSLGENMEIYGEKESFVYQYHIENEERVVEQVYSIQDNGLKKLQTQSFHGNYDGTDFSFEYAIINQEILGFNSSGDINEVFHYVDGDNVYAFLCEIDDDTFTKGCIARLNLKTGTVTKLTNDTTIGNMIMSPNGKTILINYRAEGYWSVFDIASRTEKKIAEINRYAHTDEVIFQDDYHVITLGKPYTKGNIERMDTIVIDLQTGKKVSSYKKCGDYDLQWLYEQKKDTLLIKNIDGTISIQIDKVEGNPHPLFSRGNYVLLGNREDAQAPYYLCNLAKKSYIKIDALSELEADIQIYLAAKEGKALLTDGKEAYLVDIDK